MTTASGGTHPCDGTNNGAHPAPVPTATAALDDGARLSGLGWDGDWFDSFQDYAVTGLVLLVAGMLVLPSRRRAP